MAEVRWRIVVRFHPRLWKTFGIRLANPVERATMNFLASFPPDIVEKGSSPRARKKGNRRMHSVPRGKRRKPLATSRHLDPHHPRTGWSRRLRPKPDHPRRTRQYGDRGFRPAECVRNLQVAGRVFEQDQPNGASRFCHIDLADGGTLTLAEMAYEVLSWHFGLEDLVVAALDMGSKTRCPKEGVRVVPGDAMKLEYYLGTNLYDPNLDIERVECSCTEEVVDTTQEQQESANARQRRSTMEERMKQLNTGGFLQCSHTPTAQQDIMKAGREFSKQDPEKLDRFIEEFKAAATRLGRDATQEPEFYEEEDPLDTTLEPRQDDEAELPGPIRRGSRLLHLNLFPDAEPYSKSTEKMH